MTRSAAAASPAAESAPPATTPLSAPAQAPAAVSIAPAAVLTQPPDSAAPGASLTRAARLDAFLTQSCPPGWAQARRDPLPGDASFRRYIRLWRDDGARAMLMDAPPPEQVGPFLAVGRHLRAMGFSAPDILAEDPAQGFLLLEDLGDDTFTRLLAQDADEAALYALGLDALIALHQHPDATALPGLPPYDEARLLAEVALLADWYVPAMLGQCWDAPRLTEWRALWQAVLPLAAAAGAPTLVLRDYHVDNLLQLDRPGWQGCGLLDFQDALAGPAAYDVMSLLEDARRDVPAELQAALLERYSAAFPALDRVAFLRALAVLAAQRHAKVIGIFTRLWRRDGKPVYLRHIPRVLRLLENALEREPALHPLRDWLAVHLPPAARRCPDGPLPESRQ